jgi:glucosamine--fructose-6-phosphate aminotransferase (isomerizing)
MCDIVGIVSSDKVAPLLVKSIARLEYRGYDSCGVATLGPTGIEVRKDAGAVEEVAFREGLAWLAGPLCIVHTCRATHAVVSQANAHPHLSCRRKL